MPRFSRGDILDGIYRLEAEVGQGSMGIVFRALDVGQGRPVAVKIMKPEAAADARLRRLFRREARAMARLNHPGIIEIYGYGLIEERPYLAMEWFEGEALNKLSAPSNLETVVALFDRILEALAHAHSRGVIHRDLKPANILVSRAGVASNNVSRGSIKLVDFGIARIFENFQKPKKKGRTRSFSALAQAGFKAETNPYEVRLEGTPHYMAPELYKGVDGIILPANDIYAVGVILYELLTGSRVFEADSEMALMALQLKGDIPRPVPRPELGITIPPTSLIRRMLDPDPITRIAHAADVRRAMMGWFREQDASRGAMLREEGVARAPLPVWQSSDPVEETRAAPSHTAAHSEPEINLIEWRPVPVVGRAREQAWLWQKIEGLLSGGGASVVLLEGEMGLGKTHLARWLVETADESGLVQPMWCGLGPTGLIDAIRNIHERSVHAMGLDGEHLTRRLREVLTHRRQISGAVHELLPVEEEIELLRRFLRPDRTGPEGLSGLDEPTTLRGNLLGVGFDGVEEVAGLHTRALRSASRIRPVVFVFDNIEARHLDGVMRLLDHTVRSQRAGPFPLLVVMTTAPEVFNQLSESGRHSLDYLTGTGQLSRLTLGPLEASDILVVLGRFQSFDTTLHETILLRAQGNPLVATELALQALRAAARGEEIDLSMVTPEGISDLWRQRISMIAASSAQGTIAVRVLELIALLGAPVWMDLLNTAWNAPGMESIWETGDEVPRAWDMWVENNVLVENGYGGVAFRYGLLRDTLLTDMKEAPGRARLYHSAAAWARKQLDLVRTPEDWLRMARHLIEADEHDEAWIFANGAAQHMLRSADLRAAQRAFQSCETILRRLDAPMNDPRYEPVDVGFFHLAWRLGDPEQARSRAESLCKRGRRIGSLRQLGMGELLQAELALRDAAPKQSEELFDRALSRFETSSDHAGQAEALIGLARLALRSGRARVAMRTLRSSESKLRKLGDAEGLGRVRMLMGEASCAISEVAEAEDHFNAALGQYERLGDRLGQSRAISALGQIAQARGDLDRAAMMFADYLEQAEALGDIPAAAQARANLGQARLQLGDVESAVWLLEGARRATADLQDIGSLAVIETILALALTRQGAWPQAVEMLRRSLETIHRLELYDIDLAESLEGIVMSPEARSELSGNYRPLVEHAARQWRNLGFVDRAHRVVRRAGV